MRELSHALIVLALAASGCAEAAPHTIPIDAAFSDDDDGGEGGSSTSGGEGAAPPLPGTHGAEIYALEVHADLVAACGLCHESGATSAPIFMASSAAASYAALEGYPRPLIDAPANSLLFLKGDHAGPGLSGADVPAGLAGAVESWLLLEAEERGITAGAGPLPEGPTFDEAMQAFAACMELGDWEAAGMQLLPQQQTQGWGPCVGCHNTGVGGLLLAASSVETFEQTQANKYRLQKYVAPQYDGEGLFVGLTTADRLIVKGSEQCPFPDPQDCHPKYLLQPVAQQAIQSFVTQTLSRIDNGTCGP